MTITVELFQDTGAVTSGHGTTRLSVNNVGWKDSPLDETNTYVFYPLVRPELTPFGYSYKIHTYMKISGTYPLASRPRFRISGSVIGARPPGYEGEGNSRLFCKLTNTYSAPSKSFDGSLIYVEPGQELTLYPRMSTTGPEAATSYVKYLSANTTYYSEYLVTQLFVEQGMDIEIGNIGQLQLSVFVDEYESTDV